MDQSISDQLRKKIAQEFLNIFGSSNLEQRCYDRSSGDFKIYDELVRKAMSNHQGQINRHQKSQELNPRQPGHCLPNKTNNTNLHNNTATSNNISVSNNASSNQSIHNKMSQSDPLDALKTLTVQAGQNNMPQIIGRNQSTNISHPTNQNLSNLQSSDVIGGQSQVSMKTGSIPNKANLSAPRMATSIPPNTNSSTPSSILQDVYQQSSLPLPISTVSSASIMSNNQNSRPISNNSSGTMNPVVYGNPGMHHQRQNLHPNSSTGGYMPMNPQQYHAHQQLSHHPHQHIASQHMQHHPQQHIQPVYHHHHHHHQSHANVNRMASGGGGGSGSHMQNYPRHSISHQNRQHMYQHIYPGSVKNNSSNYVSEEESKKVQEEVRRLREKYIVSLRSAKEKVTAQQANNNTSEFGKKGDSQVWDMIQMILEDPTSLSKPLSMEYIPKIELHLQKAERLANEGNNKVIPHEIGGISKPFIPVIPDQSKSSIIPRENNQSPGIISISNNITGLSNQSPSANQSLDVAFNTVCSELISLTSDVSKRKRPANNDPFEIPNHKKSAQNSVINHGKSKVTKLHSQIPKSGIDDNSSINTEKEKFDPKEFDCEATQPSIQQLFLNRNITNIRSRLYRSIDEALDPSIVSWYSQFNSRSKLEFDWWDKSGLLRIDLDPEIDEFESLDFDTEITKLQSEFKFELLDQSDNVVNDDDKSKLKEKENGDELKENVTNKEETENVISSQLFKKFNGTIRFKMSYLDKNISSKDSCESLPPETMPSVILTVDSDYTDSGIVNTWKIQQPDLLIIDQQHCQSEHFSFSQLVSELTKANFRVHNLATQWDGFCLTHIAYLLKISILTATHRISMI